MKPLCHSGDDRATLRLPGPWLAIRTFLIVLGFTFATSGGEPAGTPRPAVDFNREVRPILAKRCFACHGPDEAKRARGLRLDRHDSAVALLKSGETAIVPGDPDSSALVARIINEDETLRMPPRKLGPRLTAAEIETLTRWIKEGAGYAPHWALVPPKLETPPAVRDQHWARNPLDRWVLARIEQEGLAPSPEADRYTLVRRLSLDLRGLPPTPAEIERFVHDPAPDYLERAVDRFLADPAFGERWARMWLDLARYADSAGYGSDPLRLNIWRYRDWVIDAFNRDIPYDQFTIAQLAGDLLDHPSLADRMATAFHRNTMTNTEGGTDDEEWRVAAVKDRVDTTMQVWMGLTAGCAKCHSHKFDPITQDEYYQIFAFFNQSADADRPDESPTIPVPTPFMSARIAAIDAQLAKLRSSLEQAPFPRDAFTKWVSAAAPASSPARKGMPPAIQSVLDLATAKRSKAQNDSLERYFRTIAVEFKPIRDQLAALEKEKPKIPLLAVMEELPKDRRRVTKLLRKGNYLDPGHPVQAATPKALNPFPAGAPVNRLGLARWLIDARNPLTARVAVNRLWARIFGTGLVESEEDFGVQGEPPSHPALLDWLALEYRDSGWDTKAFLRLITTSAVYRQSSRTTAELLAREPRNRLLARFPRIRLEAEMVRDQALEASGLLCRKLGGPSVFPVQPDGLWQAAFNGERTWKTSTGGDRHRRGIYTFWRRTTPYPSMTAFDAPSREICAIKRVPTNTPLQALVTLNDPVYVEVARALARRMAREGGISPRDRVGLGLLLCLGRPARPEQVEPLIELYHAELKRYQNDPASAAELAGESPGPSAAEQAAWTAVSSVLLNLDGFLTRG